MRNESEKPKIMQKKAQRKKSLSPCVPSYFFSSLVDVVQSDCLNYATINIEYMNLNWPFGNTMLMTQMKTSN